MPRVAAKICGLSTPETLDAALAARAAHVGFVFFAKSPRNVTPDQARALATRAEGVARRVGVFVDPDDALLAVAIAAGLDAVQLHGDETPERTAAIRQRFSVETWKAIPVRTAADLTAAGRYRGAADRLLFDAKTPRGADLPGGLGLRFDWRLLEGYRHAAPWALSGGLDADNVAEAAGITGATLVDVSSGVESAAGVKDVDRIAAFCQAVGRL
ncbi:phosphoribosylanthranilate isomerase [Sphingomonas quercus]|uniref:N-(5'-phosphoribosyl)anthranilate isomerase n=1 Tax=Sphingomonas quercus TaxID=2842451 RepID=A0ABS6BM80_9SPHN|nr:phosphoribosylanthranilate isomerase [Sphingomonas quercus]MBU3079427.1 phosphoribosylanthranilate isomerase [Sphingomonas quercus]